MVGYGGVVGGGDGEGESEEMRIASGGFGRRRFDVDCVGRANADLLCSSPPVSSSSEPVSSISSRLLFRIAPARWDCLEKGEACCVATVAFSVADFWVEPKLNLGAGVNCCCEEID